MAEMLWSIASWRGGVRDGCLFPARHEAAVTPIHEARDRT